MNSGEAHVDAHVDAHRNQREALCALARVVEQTRDEIVHRTAAACAALAELDDAAPRELHAELVCAESLIILRADALACELDEKLEMFDAGALPPPTTQDDVVALELAVDALRARVAESLAPRIPRCACVFVSDDLALAALQASVRLAVEGAVAFFLRWGNVNYAHVPAAEMATNAHVGVLRRLLGDARVVRMQQEQENELLRIAIRNGQAALVRFLLHDTALAFAERAANVSATNLAYDCAISTNVETQIILSTLVCDARFFAWFDEEYWRRVCCRRSF
jgi:hypothetical protein